MSQPRSGDDDASRTTYIITIDYEMTLAEMLTAGNYDFVNDDITARNFSFPNTGTHHLRAELFAPSQSRTSDDIVIEMIEAGLDPGKLEHLLAFGAAYPNQHGQIQIITLGSDLVVSPSCRRVPCLREWHQGRHLNLTKDEGNPWPRKHRFLGIRRLRAA